jgi:3-hydroxyisobutyrate dehydrogenase-like beta-hydroxyacid dehydrogenase
VSASAGVVGVIGLGQIGGGVCRALARQGWSVTAHDVSAAAREPLASTVTFASSPAAVAAEADVVLIAVLDESQVRDVLAGEAGIADAAAPRRTVVVLSTIDVETIEWAGELGRARGFAVVDCGVTGGAAAAAAGTLVAMLGGDQSAVAAVRPVVGAFSSEALHVGPLGAGLRLKLARNLVTYGSWMVADEAARLAAAGGIDVSSLVEVIRASDPLTGGVTGMLAGDSGSRPAPAALAAIANKDLRAALSLAERAGLDLPSARLAIERIGSVVRPNQAGSND